MPEATETATETEPLACSECDQTSLLEIDPCCVCNFPICSDCKVSNGDGERYCQECYDDNHSFCHECNEAVHLDDTISIGDNNYCESCADDKGCTCDCCGNRVLSDDTHSDDHTTICDSCYEDSYFTCRCCSDLTHNDDYASCSGCDRGNMCSHCRDTHEEECSRCKEAPDLYEHAEALLADGAEAILDRDHAMEWNFHSDPNDLPSDPYTGIELEVECLKGEKLSNGYYPSNSRDAACRCISKHMRGYAFTCYDGSLTNGFEIVTMPHRRQAFRNRKIINLLRALKTAGATSHDNNTCGLHIHIERIPWFSQEIRISETYASKLLDYFISEINNADLFQLFYYRLSHDILGMSRRTPSQCEEFCSFGISRRSRYLAVNLSNTDTIEVRIWRGTLNPESFRACYLFTLASIDFLRCHSPVLVLSNNTLKLKKTFISWLKRADEYQSLVKYINTKKLFGY